MADTSKVALIKGGMSGERDVSLSTGVAFESALKELGFNYIVIDAKEDLPQVLMKERPTVALLALHGRYAEDGVVQGICEYLKIPYSGSGVLASALCMDKIVSKQVLEQSGIQTPPYVAFDSHTEERAQIALPFGFPCVVKPSREGSSLGVSICKEESQFDEALSEALKWDSQVLIEEYIPGKEISVPILDNKALVPIEIRPKVDFYNYKNKYTSGCTDYILPAEIPMDVMKTCQDLALKSSQVCRVRTYCRVDFRVTPEGSAYVMEINTLPGCTPTSLVPKAAAFEGISFESLIQTLVEKAELDY